MSNINSISFKVTAKLVDAFAQLTGDRNKLHMNEEEARSYAYRQRVAHGMLPVSALLLLEPFKDHVPMVIKKIWGRFLYPIFIGDDLTVQIKYLESDGKESKRYSFEIISSSMRTPVTIGEFEVQPGARSNPSNKPNKDSFILEQIQENVLEWEQVQKGCHDKISFNTNYAALDSWIQELGGIKKDKEPTTLPIEMIAVMMSSTLIGMRLPGRRATFLDFSFEFAKPLQVDVLYEMKGSVNFISTSTRVMLEKIELFNTLSPMNSDVQGKISVKMEEPSKTLPTYKDLNQNFKDLGLKDKVVLITGASRGIGATTARLFACQGAKVIVNYLASVTEAKKVVDDILANSGQAIAIKADVSKRNEVQALLTQAQKAFGGVDILVNNAATDFIATPFQSLTWDKIQKDIDVIVQGAFNCSQEVIPLMIQRKGGRIINVITHATEIPPVGHTKYVVAKSALVGLSRSLAVEYAGKNILVNMVVPSMVETDLTKTVPLAVREQIRHHNPLGRHPNTEDVAKAIVFLASSYSNYTTGQKFFVTGGLAPFN